MLGLGDEEPVAHLRLLIELVKADRMLQLREALDGQPEVLELPGLGKIIPLVVVLLDAEVTLRERAAVDVFIEYAVEEGVGLGGFDGGRGRRGIPGRMGRPCRGQGDRAGGQETGDGFHRGGNLVCRGRARGASPRRSGLAGVAHADRGPPGVEHRHVAQRIRLAHGG